MLPVGQKLSTQVQRSLQSLLAIGERRQRRRLLIWDPQTLTTAPVTPPQPVVAVPFKEDQISH